VTLTDTRPAVWRRLLLPASYTLGELHEVIQAVMPWRDFHSHLFRVGKRNFGEPDEEAPSMEDEETLTLAEVFRGRCRRIGYLYDFGDSWEHDIAVEQRLDPDPETEYPVCTAGENACPPEDSGGPPGYAEKLRILKDVTHPAYAEVIDWMGEDFDRTRFDLAEANEALRYDPATPEAGEAPGECGSIQPASSAEVEGLCAWCRRRLPKDRPAITLELALCPHTYLEGLEGTYVLMPLPGGGLPVPVLVPETGGAVRRVTAHLCCEPCAEALRHAWGQREPSAPPPPDVSEN
jgi:hypothetical protein